MQLKEYLRKEKLSARQFADAIGLPLPTIQSYKYGQRVPRTLHMKLIYEMTENKVTPNDFYGMN
jgi:transcriptional regulator with XRE-family HTH domain